MSRSEPEPGEGQVASPLMLCREVQDYLKISRSTAYRLIAAGQLPRHFVGKTMRFYRSDVQKCIARQAQ